jgi:adenylate cyclase
VVRRIRLISGLILFSYLVSHFINHALGLVSLDAMEAWLGVVYRLWGSPLGTIPLYGAFLTHFALAFWALWQRRTLRLPPAQALQYLLGFAIPLIAVQHVISTRVADSFYGADTGYYTNVITNIWYFAPQFGVLQAVLVVIGWVHACIGLRFWLRVKPWYDRAQPFLFAGALLLPVLALLGFAEAAREIGGLMAADPGFAERIRARALPPASRETLQGLVWTLRILFVATIGALLVARQLRRWWQSRHGLARIAYPDGRTIRVPYGTTVLEASRLLGVPHASVCGGKGRCSTCRVRVRAAHGAIPAPSADEAKVLLRVLAPPNVRLACQLRPQGPVEVTPLLPATAHAREGRPRPGYLQGREQEIAILFADLRAFTKLAESKLPYDVVFLLNRYFAAMGHAIEEAGGRVDKFIGDGIMALFGLDSGPEAGCRHALAAARLMSARLVELNRTLEHDLDDKLRIGIGIHTGPAIVGEMGYGRTVSLTAVGDAVNTASRLETLCKTYGCELVVSDDLVQRAGIALTGAARHEIEIRGRRAPLVVHTLGWGIDLPPLAEPAVAV